MTLDSFEAALVHHNPTPQDDPVGCPRCPLSFEHVVVRLGDLVLGLVLGVGLDDDLLLGVPDDDVSIGPNLNATLIGVEPEDLGGHRACQLDKALFGNQALVDAKFPKQNHPLLHAISSHRDLGEVVNAESLLAAVKC